MISGLDGFLSVLEKHADAIIGIVFFVMFAVMIWRGIKEE